MRQISNIKILFALVFFVIFYINLTLKNSSINNNDNIFNMKSEIINNCSYSEIDFNDIKIEFSNQSCKGWQVSFCNTYILQNSKGLNIDTINLIDTKYSNKYDVNEVIFGNFSKNNIAKIHIVDYKCNKNIITMIVDIEYNTSGEGSLQYKKLFLNFDPENKFKFSEN